MLFTTDFVEWFAGILLSEGFEETATPEEWSFTRGDEEYVFTPYLCGYQVLYVFPKGSIYLNPTAAQSCCSECNDCYEREYNYY